MRRWLVPAVVVVGCVLLLLAAQHLRRRAGIDLSADALGQLRTFVLSQGLWAPAVFLLVATFRVFLLIPSWVLLATAGLAFGGILGAFLGALGITCSALLGFGLTRWSGGSAWIERLVPDRYSGLESRLESAGLMVIGLTTAHPAIPMSGLHWAAGLTALPLAGFVAAVALGASVRSSVLAFLGASVLQFGVLASVSIGIALAVVFALPLAHRGLRQRLLGGPRA